MDTTNIRTGGYTVYILLCADGSLYTGVTNDLARRIAAHNSGRGAKYTRARLPVSLAYYEGADSRADALKRESAIKRLSHRQKLALIAAVKPTAGTAQSTVAPHNTARD